MNCIFKKKKAHIRYLNGKINMITFYVPFKDLPVKARFRYGNEQDDFAFIKTGENFAYTRMCKRQKHKVMKNKIVLIDFYLDKKKNN